MASSVVFLLLLSAGLFTVTVGLRDVCKSYYTSSNVYMPSITCHLWDYCCGTCTNRYCCSSYLKKLTEDDQELCNIVYPFNQQTSPSPGLPKPPRPDYEGLNAAIAAGTVVNVVICIVFVIVIVSCCCCPCCCIYKMRQRPRPVGTLLTTVMNAQSIQQPPVMQPVQYPAYQPVPTQPGYGGQPMQTGQTYAPGTAPPPPYQVAVSPGYPSGQAAYGVSQAPYPMMPPAQPGIAHLPPETKKPTYNPANMQPPNTGY
ncbi:protein shisa-5-like [Pseudorasbora parva]|uniref:protein shisa-5-like n=1 Tax=Pseudorasbora parva TaxID=51549 RepID=UPI00351F3099